MLGLTLIDAIAVCFFAAAWIAYAVAMDSQATGSRTLNGRMHAFRRRWMEQMLHREVRIVDTQIMGSLQNGTAFFASTSLIAIGGALTLLRVTDDVVRLFAEVPLGLQTSRSLWEMKVIGLAVIFVYAFFKFAWSYRLFNYAAILLGATPPAERAGEAGTRAHVAKVAGMTMAAGRHFNRGQRAFFFALGYLGWFLSAWVFIASTAAVLVVMGLRQFRSDGLSALDAAAEDLAGPG